MSRFSRVANCSPIDAVASRVVSNGGVSLAKDLCRPEESNTPIQVLVCPRDVEDLKGRTLGYWRVLGYFGSGGGKSGSRWVVRCACGTYSIRTGRAIRRQLSKDDSCSWCSKTRKMREGFWGVGAGPKDTIDEVKANE